MWWLVLIVIGLLVAPIPTLIILPFLVIALIIVWAFGLLPLSIRIILVIVGIVWLASRAPS